MPKVSIIIPVYGVEKYIERCARSLFEQTLDDIEFIFVDDCTPDRSIEILNRVLDEYPQRKNQVKILRHDKNQGLPIARQTGLKVATGDYVIHCDSDDWVDVTMYEKMYNKAVEEQADMVVCGYQETDGKDVIKQGCHKFQSKEEYISKMLFMKETWAVWDKLCRRNLYQGLVPPQFAMGEDLVITIQLTLKAQNISIVDAPLYYYFFNRKSITKVQAEEKRYDNWKQSIDNASKSIDFISQYGLENKFIVEIIFLKYKQKKLLGKLAFDKKYAGEWINCFNEINNKCFGLKQLTLVERLKFYVTLCISYLKSFWSNNAVKLLYIR